MNDHDYYKNALDSLELAKVRLESVERLSDHTIITIHGGFNGSNSWPVYLCQIREIVEKFDAWIIDLINDCSDDVWTLRIGVEDK